jgi:hypothetical protein
MEKDIAGLHIPASAFAGLLVAALEHYGGGSLRMDVPRNRRAGGENAGRRM